MQDLSTNYMGLGLANPVIVSSSGLTQTLEGVERCAEAGAGAVVLKSIFEEQIEAEVKEVQGSIGPTAWHPEAEEYIGRLAREAHASAIADKRKTIMDSDIQKAREKLT